MLTSKEKLSEKATTKLGLATTVAVLWTATVTFAGAAVTSVQSTSVASAPTNYILEAQVQTLRECDADYPDYLDSFDGMLSDLMCGS